jgi:hypothetical protein
MKQTRDAPGMAEMKLLVGSIDGVHVGAAETTGRLLGACSDAW